MRKYLWAGVAVLCVNTHASDNPFDLEENFGKSIKIKMSCSVSLEK